MFSINPHPLYVFNLTTRHDRRFHSKLKPPIEKSTSMTISGLLQGHFFLPGKILHPIGCYPRFENEETTCQIDSFLTILLLRFNALIYHKTFVQPLLLSRLFLLLLRRLYAYGNTGSMG